MVVVVLWEGVREQCKVLVVLWDDGSAGGSGGSGGDSSGRMPKRTAVASDSGRDCVARIQELVQLLSSMALRCIWVNVVCWGDGCRWKGFQKRLG